MSPRLLYTGQVVIDLVMGIDHLPRPGGDVLAHSAQFEAGGGFNVMAAACRNGLRTCYLGRHGRGRFGDLARQAMHEEGIEWLTAIDEAQDTGLSVALIEPNAERSFISHVGAEGGLGAADLARGQPMAGDFVFVSGYSLLHPDKATCLVSWVVALEAGVTVVFDPGPLVDSPATMLMQWLLPRIDLWTSNREEALRFSGADSLPAALETIAGYLPPGARVLIRDGGNGCWLWQAGGAVHVPGFPVEALDTNGAGDAHAGVLLAGLAAGLNDVEAARRANAAAAIAVTRWGPATAPSAVELDQALAERSIRQG